MSAMAPHITGVAIVYSAVCSGADQRKHQSSALLAFVRGIHPAQKASDAENVSIWWRHHMLLRFVTETALNIYSDGKKVALNTICPTTKDWWITLGCKEANLPYIACFH